MLFPTVVQPADQPEHQPGHNIEHVDHSPSPRPESGWTCSGMSMASYSQTRTPPVRRFVTGSTQRGQGRRPDLHEGPAWSACVMPLSDVLCRLRAASTVASLWCLTDATHQGHACMTGVAPAHQTAQPPLDQTVPCTDACNTHPRLPPPPLHCVGLISTRHAGCDAESRASFAWARCILSCAVPACTTATTPLNLPPHLTAPTPSAPSQALLLVRAAGPSLGLLQHASL